MTATDQITAPDEAGPHGGPDLLTPDDALAGEFAEPYVDLDELRTEPVEHRYVHGGFRGTDTRFSFYFPPQGAYLGRFFQHVTPVPLDENLAQQARGQDDRISFSVDSGAYFVETNGGGSAQIAGTDGDATLAAYRANAAAAVYSRQVAARLYGEHRPWGYLYGGSGGAYRTIGAAESTTGVWDGFAPYVPGSPMAVPNVFSVRMHAQRVLKDVLDLVVDAHEPGGDATLLDALTAEQRAALTEVTAMGFPPRAWFGHRTMGTQAFSVLLPVIAAVDPGFFEDFWTKPGYLGADPTSSVHAARVQHESVVSAVARRDVAPTGASSVDPERGGVDRAFESDQLGGVVGLTIDPAPTADTDGAELILTTADGTVSRLSIVSCVAGEVVLADQGLGVVCPTPQVGDRVVVDNSRFLAAQTYHRHQVPPSGFPVWDQFRTATGEPAYPQRPMLLGPIFAAAAVGHVPHGVITAPMILVANLLDREAYPWQADWYLQQVRSSLGPEADGRIRLWYIDDALHADEEHQEDPTHTVSYLGVLQHALRDLADWVERGIEPAPTSDYRVIDGQVSVVPAVGGVQPVVEVLVDGGPRVRVQRGEAVAVHVSATAASDGGDLVELTWDVDDGGTFPRGGATRSVRVVGTDDCVRFDTPGRHVIAARATSQREGDSASPFARASDVARAIVEVV